YPCRMLGQELEEIEKEYDKKLVVAKVNVDEESELAYAFKVSSIPMVVLFKNGQAVTQFIGYKSKDEVLKEILPFIE
ncbi:MAG: thiol reductase thioredoxin, partial [Clostridia bacterium]|nr:thiol reductase thioredoxin [Clostridia bacterium]